LRTGFILGFILLLYGALSVRLFQIQVGQNQAWKAKANQQEVCKLTLQGQRGSISVSDGLPLAYCIPRDAILADLKLMTPEDCSAAAKALSPVINSPEPTLLAKLTRYKTLLDDPNAHEHQRVVYLARNIDPAAADKIKALKLKGIVFEDEFRRTYPQGPMLAQVVGWSGIDGGQSGIEKELDSILSGTPGYLQFYRDASHRLIALNDGAIGPGDSHPPRDGLAVTLTIDARLQQTAEEQLAAIENEYDAKSATCIVMDVTTGEVLAMACTPQFDPNCPNKFPQENWRNRPITDFYEPGSTFKTFVIAMALDRNLVRRTDIFNCENGAWNLGYRTLHDAHAYGMLSVDDIVAKSSNIGAAKNGQRLGIQGLYDTVQAFGFGHLTGINLPGEVKGMVRARKHWTNDSVYSVSMGAELGVTPIQVISAFSAVVNGGTLYRPKIVKRIINEQGEELYTLHPQAVRRVISEHTSQQMRQVLARVVAPGGTGVKAFCPEYSIGGKTGTTRKLDPGTHNYSTTLYIGSFCGFAPVENPRLCCLVVVDEPRKGSGYYGGTVACPAVREVLRKGLMLLNIPPHSAD